MADINRLATTQLGKINNWEDKKASTITPISFPGQNAELTEGVDTLGIISYINISGRLTGSFETMQSTINVIKTILDGAQTLPTTFFSPFINGTRVGTTLTAVKRQGHIGTNTSVTSNKLVDSTANFDSWGVEDGKTTDVDGVTMEADYVKNLITGEVANVTNVDSDTSLTLSSDIFTSSGTPYAVTTNINVKVLSFDVRWEIPGMTYVDYQMSLMQVR